MTGTQTEAKEHFISNYCDDFKKTLKDVEQFVKEKITKAQRKQKDGYDVRNNVDKSRSFNGDLVWLNNPKGWSQKFHLQWCMPYKVLNRLGGISCTAN